MNKHKLPRIIALSLCFVLRLAVFFTVWFLFVQLNGLKPYIQGEERTEVPL